MADIHDQAMEWAQANPTDPRAQDIQAKAWASKNPSDPRAEQILAKLSMGGTKQNPNTPAENQDMAAQNPNLLGRAGGLFASRLGGLVKGLSFGHADPSNLPGSFGKAFKGDTSDPTLNSMAEGLGGAMGSTVVTAPIGAAAGALTKGTSGIGGFLGRQAVNATQGAVTAGLEGKSPVTGGALGLGLGVAGEGIGGLLGAGSRVVDVGKKAMAIKQGSPALQQEANQALAATSKVLRNDPLKQPLEAGLAKATVTVDPKDFMGHSDDADAIIQKYLDNNTGQYGKIPSTIDMSGTDLANVRRSLDSNVKFKDIPYNSLTPQQIKSQKDSYTAANKAREAINGISEDVKNANESISTGIQGANALESKGSRPLSYLSNKNPDVRATINDLGDKAGTDLPDLASKLRSAKVISNNPVKGALTEMPLQAVKGMKNSSTVTDPNSLQALLASIMGAKNE